MNEIHSEPPKKNVKNGVTWLHYATGIVLLAAAALLYWHDIKRNKEQIEAALAVRLCTQMPIMAMGLLLDTTGSASNTYMLCTADIATNILSNLAKAEPITFPRRVVEGEEYQMFLMYTNRSQATLRAVRLYNDPSNLYVGVWQPVKFDENDKPIAWDFTLPAQIPGLGTLFHELAVSNIPLLRARVDDIKAANREGQIIPQKPTGTTPDLNAWMDPTQAPPEEPTTAADGTETP